MTNDQLRALIAVVECGSFRGAATQLYKTQSTISAAIRALETEFSLQLFDRSYYRPQLTSEGKSFYQQASRLLQQVQQLEKLGHTLATNPSPKLSISMSAMCALPPGLDIIQNFCNQRPNLKLTIHTEHLSGVLEQLDLEKADFAIGPHTGLDDRYEFAEISRIHMITIAAKGYLPCVEDQPVPQSVLRPCPHILISDTGSRAPFDHINVIPGGQRWYVGDYQMKKALILAKMGWARIPAHMVESELQQGDLITIDVEQFPSRSEVPIYLIRLKQKLLSQEASALWQEMLSLNRTISPIDDDAL